MSRRVRLVLWGVGVVTVVVATLAVVEWRATRFPATERPVEGTPFTLAIQAGTSSSDVAAVRRGLLVEQAFLGDRLGRAVRGALDVRLARGDPCERSGGPAQAPIAMEREHFLCVNTRDPRWEGEVRARPAEAVAVSAHELVHRWQRELGCGGSARVPVWFIEGNAVDFAWRAVVRAGLMTDAQTARTIRVRRAFDTRVGPLERYETTSGGDPEYAMWHLAFRDLLRRAPDGVPAVRRFCESVGRGQAWKPAFEAAFGLTPARFYRAFETARPEYRSGTRPL